MNGSKDNDAVATVRDCRSPFGLTRKQFAAKISVMWSTMNRLNRLWVGCWVCAVVCLFVIPVSGAELNVNLDVIFRDDAGRGLSTGPQSQERHASIFVVDRSGSMNEADQPDGKTRWSALLDGVKADLAKMPDGQAVGVVIFQTEVMPIQTFSGGLIRRGLEYRLLDSPGARDEVWKRIADNPPISGKRGGKWKGATALYDALGTACELANRLRDDGFKSVSILVHSDGQDTSSRRFKGMEDIKRRYRESWERFDEMRMVGRWWGDDKDLPPDMVSIFQRKQGYVRLHLPQSRLQHPVITATQSLNLQLVVDVPRDLWGEVEGKDARLACELNNSASTDLNFILKSGRQALTFPLSGNLPKNQEIKGLLKVCGLPVSDKFTLHAPNAVQIVFEKPGVVSLSVKEPAPNLRVIKGDEVAFRVEGTTGAAFNWHFNGVHGGTAPALKRKLDDTVEYVVTASKPGLLDAAVTGKVEVVDAYIKVHRPERNPRVGEVAAFKVDKRGTEGDIQWFINNRHAEKFKEAGPHIVKAQAEVPGIRCIFAEIKVEVDPAPIIEIAELNDSVFDAKSNVVFRARVLGFDKIDWKFTGPETKTQNVPVAKNTAELSLSFAKGGHYEVSASGVLDGKTLTSNTQGFDIRPQDMWVKILEPLGSEIVVNKPEGVACTFVAQVKGDDITKIKWSVKQAETGAMLFEDDVRDLDGGRSSATWIFSPAHAGVLSVTAEAVFKSNQEMDASLVSGSRTIWVRPEGTVSVISPAKNTLLPFDATQVFEARIAGAVDPKVVSWYQLSREGDWQPLPGADGTHYSHSFRHTGKPDDFVDLRVAAGGPDSRWQDTIRIRLQCPRLSPKIVLPMTNGVPRTEFGLREKISFGLVADGNVQRVDWSFGDGNETNGTAGITHSYSEYGAFTITARATCSKCQGVETAHAEIVKVVKTAGVPLFALLPDKETFSVGGKLTLIDQSSGDVKSLLWVTNGTEVAGARGEPFEISLPNRPTELTVGLRVVGEDGDVSEMYKRKVRVRFGWWALIPILLAAFLVWRLIYRLLTGNEPRGWTVYAWDGAAPKLLKGEYPEERNHAGKGVPTPIKQHWNWFTKKASMPIVTLLGMSDDTEGSGNAWEAVSREERFVFRADGGKPIVDCPNIVNEVSGMVASRDVDHYFLFQDAVDVIGKEREFVRVVVEEGPSGWFCPVSLVLSTFAIIGVVFWLCLRYVV